MMVVRYTNVLAAGVLSVLAFAATTGWAQVATDDPASNGAAATELFDDTTTDAADDVDDIFAGIDDQEPTPAETATQSAEADNAAANAGADATAQSEPQPAAQPDGVEAPNQGPDMATAAAPATSDEVHQLRERVAAMQTEIAELKTELGLLREAQARLSESDFTTQALGAMADDPDLRSNMGQMLQGKVRLINNTGQPVVMYINGTAWTVVTGESFVHAPVGTVAFMHNPEDVPTFKGIQEWTENRQSGQFELEYTIGETNTATQATSASERSVMMKVPLRRP